jgi:hypothetical protein
VYDPRIGRFLSRDPYIDGVGSSQGANGYAYVHNNPLSHRDPTGYAMEIVVDHGLESVVVTESRSTWTPAAFHNFLAALRHRNEDRGGGRGAGGGGSGRSISPPAEPKEMEDAEQQTDKLDSCNKTAQAKRSLGDDISDAAVGFGDAFLIPIIVRDLRGIDGGVDYESDAYLGGKVAGTVWGLVPLALGGAAAAGATRAGHVLNHNRYLRIGPGRWGKDMVPRASSKYLPGDGHVNLSSRLPPIPPMGALADESNCP